ncbi:15865_t:CDS:2 [Gigaspora rosea]|nr:15865_t:CDS:2 [Gigaspora rosea]
MTNYDNNDNSEAKNDNNEAKNDLIELHNYTRKPEIKYKDPSTGTYYYTIISEEYYPFLPKLKKKYNMDGLRQLSLEKSVTHVANLFAQIYNSKRTLTLSGPIIFRLQLKCVKQIRNSRHRSNILHPFETFSNLGKSYQIKQIGEKVNDYINDETTHLYYKDQVQVKSLTLSVDNQD